MKTLRALRQVGRSGGRRDASISIQKTHAKRVAEAATVVVVDDDPSVLRALSRLIRSQGFRVLSFDRPSVLLASTIPKTNACMVVDINLPEMSGTELCSALAASGARRRRF